MEKPDGSLAWTVAFAACVINFVMAGLGRTSGILYVAFIEMFGISRGLATTPFTVRSSTRNILGPLVGILGQQYGVRTVTIMGGVIGAVSSASCYFVSNINWIIILWGGINGLGAALTTTLPQVIIGQYFKKYHTTAAGLAFSGGCVGSFLFPVFIEYFLHHFDLQNTFLIISGIIMHVIPAAMILKRPPWVKINATNKVNRTDVHSIILAEECNSRIEQSHDNQIITYSNISNTYISSAKEKRFRNNMTMHIGLLDISRNKSMYIEILHEIIQFFISDEQFAHFNENVKLSEAAVYQFVCNLCKFSEILNNSANLPNVREKIFSTFEKTTHCVEITSVRNIFNQLKDKATLQLVANHLKTNVKHNYYTVENLENYILSLITCYEYYEVLNEECKNFNGTIDNNDKKNINKKDVPRLVQKYSLMENIRIAFKLNKNPIFHLICLCRAVHFITFIPVVTIVVDFGMDKGFQEEDGKYIIAALSAGDLLGRLGLGWITDRGYLKLSHYMLLIMILQGITTIFLPFIHNVGLFLTTLGLFGMFQGSVFIRHPVLVSKYMADNEQSIAMGCINFMSGLIGFGLPAYIGYFRDTLGSYDRMFYITGGLGTLVGFLWITEPKLASSYARNT